jgi:hypothetical protein
VKAVHEFEAERDQERDEKQEERRVTGDFRAGGVDIGVTIEPGRIAASLIGPLVLTVGPTLRVLCDS